MQSPTRTTSRVSVCMLTASAMLAASLCLAAAAGAQTGQHSTGPTQATYTRDLPAALVRQAKVAESVASATAQARFPMGHINGVELENESGKLIYSYEIRVPGKSGIEEVNVDAMTGSVVGAEHESPKAAGKETKKEGH